MCAPSAAPPSGVAVPLDDALLDLLRVLHPEVDVAEAPDAVASARARTACVLRVGGLLACCACADMRGQFAGCACADS